jgi:catechol 2,3-dioxygenase-like lactoylglutathione lyase family enzyme
MDHIGVTVTDLEAATEFFTELGLEVEGESMTLGGEEVDRITSLQDVETEVVMLRVPDGPRVVELCTFNSPPTEDGSSDGQINARGFRHLCFQVDDIEDTLSRLQGKGATLVGDLVNYEEYSYKLCYLRGPEGIIVELAEQAA